MLNKSFQIKDIPIAEQRIFTLILNELLRKRF